jgi:hypothetical protein
MPSPVPVRPQTAPAQGGYVLPATAVLLVVLLGFTALAVDIGVLLGARTAAQRAADAGALAGAFSFAVNQIAVQPDTAQAHALAVTAANRVLSRPITAAEITVDVNVAQRLVTVDVIHPAQTYFARVLGIDSVNVRGHASAEAFAHATGAACAKPWFMPNTILSSLPACEACAAGEVFISGGAVTAWAAAQRGHEFTLKPNNPAASLAPGQFYAIRMADSTGGNDYRANIASCSPQQIRCQQTYGAEPGNMIGPTLQGVRDLIGPVADTWQAPGEYVSGIDGATSDTSRQLITIPVWDSCGMVGFCPAGELPDNGANVMIPVAGFAQVFLDGVAGSNVVGRLVGISACAAGGGGSGGTGGGGGAGEIGPYGVPVRLVRTDPATP